jgi:PAS domain S-box-containing protein
VKLLTPVLAPCLVAAAVIAGRDAPPGDRAAFLRLGVLVAVVLAGTAGLSYLVLGREVIRPARAIRAAIQRRTCGDRTAYAPVLARDVLGDIAIALNCMVDAMSAGEERYRSLVEGSLQGIHIYQAGRIRFANRSLARIFGYGSESELIGQPHRILLAPHEIPRFEGHDAARMLGEPAPARVELQGIRRDGEPIWVETMVSVVPWEGAPASLVTTIDVTERRRAEEALRARVREMESLMEIGRALASSLDTHAVLQLIVGHAARLLGIARAGVAILEREGELASLRFVAVLGLSPQFSRQVRYLTERQGTTPAAIARRRPVWSANILTDPAFELLPDTRASVEAEGYCAVLSAPLLLGDRVLGALAVYRDAPGPFPEAEIHLLETFAAHAAIALENARLFAAARRAPSHAAAEPGRA